MENQENTRATWVLIGVLAGSFLLFALFLFVALLAVTGREHGIAALTEPEGPKIGVVELTGVILESKDIVEQLNEFAKDEGIAAVVLRIDSPGGSVGPSQEIFQEVKRVREKKKIVVSMGAVAASGGYYAACAADKIFASPSTITGSIGVIAQLSNVKELLDWAKIKTTTYKSGPLKDAGSGLRDPTPEDEEMFNGLIQDIYRQFVKDVAEARQIPEDDVRAVADGRVLTGSQARDAKLIDEFGNFRQAVEQAVTLAGLSGEARLVYPKKDREELLRELFESAARGVAMGLGQQAKLNLLTLWDVLAAR